MKQPRHLSHIFSVLTKTTDRLVHAHPRTQMNLAMTALIKTIQNIDTRLGDDVPTHLRVSKIMSKPNVVICSRVMFSCFVLFFSYLALLQVYKTFPIDVLVFCNILLKIVNNCSFYFPMRL